MSVKLDEGFPAGSQRPTVTTRKEWAGRLAHVSVCAYLMRHSLQHLRNVRAVHLPVQRAPHVITVSLRLCIPLLRLHVCSAQRDIPLCVDISPTTHDLFMLNCTCLSTSLSHSHASRTTYHGAQASSAKEGGGARVYYRLAEITAQSSYYGEKDADR